MRSYSVKENPIGSTVSEILRYKQTDIVLLCIRDIKVRSEAKDLVKCFSKMVELFVKAF